MKKAEEMGRITRSKSLIWRSSLSSLNSLLGARTGFGNIRANRCRAHAKIVLPNGLVCEELNATATRSFAVFANGLKFAAPGKYGFYTKVTHGN